MDFRDTISFKFTRIKLTETAIITIWFNERYQVLILSCRPHNCFRGVSGQTKKNEKTRKNMEKQHKIGIKCKIWAKNTRKAEIIMVQEKNVKNKEIS